MSDDGDDGDDDDDVLLRNDLHHLAGHEQSQHFNHPSTFLAIIADQSFVSKASSKANFDCSDKLLSKEKKIETMFGFAVKEAFMSFCKEEGHIFLCKNLNLKF